MGLVAYYKLDEDVLDYSGNGYNGINNGVSFVSGQVNNAGDFDGSTSYIQVPDLQSFTELGFSVWINSDVLPSDDSTNNHIIAIYGNDGDSKIIIWVSGTTNRIQVLFENSAGTQVQLSYTTAITIETWYNIFLNWDGTTLELFVNNDLKDSDSISGTVDLSTLNGTNEFIGAFNTSANNWDGKIDEVRIYDHVLSTTERTRLYNWSGTHEIEIDGKDYSFDLVDFTGIKKFGQVGKEEALLTDSTNTTRNTINTRDDFVYKYQGTKRFRGFVNDVPELTEAGLLQLSVKGYEQRFFERFITVSYTSQTLDYIIKDIIDTYYSGEFTYVNVPVTVETYSIEYRGESPWFIFNDLAKREDKFIFVDEDKDLNLVELFTDDTGLNLDYDASDAIYNPEFPDYGSSIFNSIIIYSKMKDPDGNGGVAVRYNNYESIAEYGEVIEMAPKVVTTASTEEECFDVGRNIIDELAFKLQDGSFETTYSPEIYPGQMLRLSLDSRNINNSQFIIKRVSHSIRPLKTYVEVAEIKSSTLKILKGVLQTMQSNEERHRDQSATISNQYVIAQEIPISFTIQIDKQNVGDRDWNEVAWNSFSWIASSNTWTSVLAETDLTVVADGRTALRDLILGTNSTHLNVANVHIGAGDDSTSELVTQTDLINQIDINRLASKNKKLQDAGYPLEPDNFSLRFQSTIEDEDLISDDFYEFAIFDAESGGNMIGRYAQASAIQKNSDESLRIRFNFSITSSNSDGEIALVNSGRTKARDLIHGTDAIHLDNSNTYLGLGDDTTTVSLTDTVLNSPIDINADGGETRAPMDATYPKTPSSTKILTQASIEDADVVTDTFFEAGLFDANSGGTMYLRNVILAGITKNSGEALRVKHELEVRQI